MGDDSFIKTLEYIGIGALGTALVLRATRGAQSAGVAGLGQGSSAGTSAFTSRMLPARGVPDSTSNIDREAYLDQLFDDLARNAMQQPTIRKSEVYVIHSRVAAISHIIQQWGESPKFRQVAGLILSRRCGVPSGADGKWCVAEQDWEGEAEALFNEVRKRIRYMRDPPGRDTFSSPDHSILIRSADCFVKGTKVLNDKHELVAIESLRVGDKIWGYDKWSTVMNTWEKGVLPTWKIKLNNGSSMRLTPEHKVWIAECPKHVGRKKSKPCSCPVSARTQRRITVRELKPGMTVLQPSKVDFGAEVMDADRAYVEGLYVSDGWCSSHGGDTLRDFCISGQDGCPKEEQKRRVQEICARLGIKTNWQRKHISVKDPAWAERVHTFGTRAPVKQVPSLGWNEEATKALLLGVLADSGKNRNAGCVFTTTSHTLALQTRVLAKMTGITCGEQYIEKHGGLGKNPIWRLSLREPGQRAAKLLQVKSVTQDNLEMPCFDIETDDHYVWLPEADWTVSQCDCYAIILAVLLRCAGVEEISLRVVQTRDPRTGKPAPDWDHIYIVCDPGGTGKWIALDASQPHRAGWEVEGAAKSANTGKPAEMIYRVKDFPVPLTR